jgi:DNA-binding YbaB/EbfC family protein
MPKIPDMNQIMKMAQNMSNNLKEKMDKLEVTGNAGGGMVKVVMNGHKNLIRMSIEEEVIDPGEKEMLTDLIIAAVNDAIGKVDDELKGEMGGMLPPGMGGGLPF